MSKNFLSTVQGLNILEKTILAYIIGRGLKPTTGGTLCRKINIVNSADEANVVTAKLEKSMVIRKYGTDGHVITKDFRADEKALAEMETFSPTVSIPRKKVPKVKEQLAPIKILTETASTDPKRELLLKQISNVANKLNRPMLPGINNLDLKKEALAGLADIFSSEDAELQALLLEISQDLDAIASAV
jgi:hypothetical protein